MGRCPGLVIQSNALNDSKINTVIMLAITSTLKFADLPGNVTIRKGEANMPMKCAINATQIKSVDKASLTEKIGSLSNQTMEEVVQGLQLVMDIEP